MAEPKTQAQRIVFAFESIPNMVKYTGYSEDLVRSWLRKSAGFIPTKYWLHILISAWKAGYPMSTHDFVAHLDDLLAEEISRQGGIATPAQAASSAVPA